MRLISVVVVFAAGVKLTVDQLPVVFALVLVVIERDAAPEILDADGAVMIGGDIDLFAISLARFVHGIGKNLKYRMLAALQPVGTEDDRGTAADSRGAFEHRDTFVVVYVCFFRHLSLLCAACTALKLGIERKRACNRSDHRHSVKKSA